MKLGCMAGVEYKDKIVFSSTYINGLDSLLVIDMREHYISSINIFNNPEEDLIYSAYIYQGKINLLSQKGLATKTICIEDNNIEKGSWKYCSDNCLSAIQSETDLYLIPVYLEGEKTKRIIKVNLVSGDVFYIDMPDTREEYYGGVCINNYLLLLPDRGTNILKMNIEKQIFEKVSYPNELKNKLSNCDNTARVITSREKILISLVFNGFIFEFDKNGSITNYFNIERIEYTEVQKIITEYKEKGISLSPILLKEEEIFSISEYIQIV